ncbi:MAG: hypothetical protein R2911_44065 [Caldilineaceae bacterium]
MSAIETTNPLNGNHQTNGYAWAAAGSTDRLGCDHADCFGCLWRDLSAIATGRDAQAFPPLSAGDAGSYRLHLSCMGQGSPTAILESGQANSPAAAGRLQSLGR